MGLGVYDEEYCRACRKLVDTVWWFDSKTMCRECILKQDRAFFLHRDAFHFSPRYDNPNDVDGFPGGDRRNNVYPTTRESALNALLDFVPEKDRSEIEDMIRDVLNVLDEQNYNECDEEE